VTQLSASLSGSRMTCARTRLVGSTAGRCGPNTWYIAARFISGPQTGRQIRAISGRDRPNIVPVELCNPSDSAKVSERIGCRQGPGRN
jgi:hypothetical protein